MYVSNHVGSVSSTAAAAAWATTAARGFSTFAWSLTDLRSFCATPRPLLTALSTGRAARGAGAGAKAAAAAKSAQRSLFIVAGRALKLQTATSFNCTAQQVARAARCVAGSLARTTRSRRQCEAWRTLAGVAVRQQC